MAATIGQFLRAESRRDPDHRLFRQKLKARRRHSDDQILLPVEQNLSPDQRRIAAEPPLPQAVADHRHVVPPGLIFFPSENSPQLRLDAEKWEEVGGHALRLDLLRLTLIRQV